MDVHAQEIRTSAGQSPLPDNPLVAAVEVLESVSDEIERYRNRARFMRELAERAKDLESREALELIANNYDTMVETLLVGQVRVS